MFDIRVVFRGIRNYVVDIMISFPPAYGQSSYEIGDEDTDQRVDVEVMRNTHMTRIMDGKYELMP